MSSHTIASPHHVASANPLTPDHRIPLTLYADDALLCMGALRERGTDYDFEIAASMTTQADPEQLVIPQQILLSLAEIEALLTAVYNAAMSQFRHGEVEDGQHLLGIRDMLLIQRRFSGRTALAAALEVAA